MNIGEGGGEVCFENKISGSSYSEGLYYSKAFITYTLTNTSNSLTEVHANNVVVRKRSVLFTLNLGHSI